MKLLAIFHVLGPALLGFSIGYLLKHPEDWTGPTIIGPIGLLTTIISQKIGFSWIKKHPNLETPLRATQIAGPICGVIIGVMIYFLA